MAGWRRVQVLGHSQKNKSSRYLYWFARAVIAKVYRPGGLSHRNLSSDSFGDWKSKVEVSAGLVSALAALWLADGHVLPMSSYGLFSMHAHPCVSSSPYKDTCQIGLVPTLMALF